MNEGIKTSIDICIFFAILRLSKNMGVNGYALMTNWVEGGVFRLALKGAFPSFTDSDTLSLALTIGLISILGYLMEKYLILDRMIYSLENILRSSKATILISPAIIGTLLVTGGALMSCPVVDGLGNRLDIKKDKRAAINLIFRHALYFIFPLSPALILASNLGDFNIIDFIKLQFPIAIAMYIAGYFLYLRGYNSPKIEKISFKKYLISILEFILYNTFCC